MGEWDQMSEYVSKLDDRDERKLRTVGNTTTSGDGSSNGAFFRAVLSVRPHKYDEARAYVERARKCLAVDLAALVRTLNSLYIRQSTRSDCIGYQVFTACLFIFN